ncbi:MAG: type II secretion system protein [Clostridia bacterium]
MNNRKTVRLVDTPPPRVAARTSRPSGFTMIELIGAMIIIAVLTAAGISAVSTAIEHSRQVACDEDLAGFRAVAEQFLLENPQVSNSEDMAWESINLLDGKYLEGEMKFIDNNYTKPSDIAIRYTNRLDPWGEPYAMVFVLYKLETDNQIAKNYSRIFIRSKGKNGNHAKDQVSTEGFLVMRDTDDRYSLTQYADGQVISTTFDTQYICDTVSAHPYILSNYGYNYHTNNWQWLRMLS